MKMNYGFEAGFSLIPSKGRHLLFEDRLYLNDNIGEGATSDHAYVYEGVPVKIGFALGGFCLRGSCVMRVNLIEYKIEAGQHLLLPLGSIIDYFKASPDNEYVQIGFSDINFSILMNSDMVVAYEKGIMNQPTVTTLSDTALKGFLETYQLMRLVVEDDTIINKRAVLGGYIYAMGQWLFCEKESENAKKTNQPRNRNDEVFRNFKEHIQQHYQQHRNVSFYADMAHLSPKYFGQIILKVSGRNPADWIRDLVILDAKTMLLSGQYSIQQISDALNFPNSSFFAKYFKEHVGCAPGKFSFEFESKV